MVITIAAMTQMLHFTFCRFLEQQNSFETLIVIFVNV